MEEILKNLIIESKSRTPGGQACGSYLPPVRVSHPDFDIIIEINEGRTFYKRKQTAILLFELALKELL